MKIFSIVLLLAAVTTGINASSWALESPNPELGYKCIVLAAYVLVMLGALGMQQSTESEMVSEPLKIAERHGGSTEVHHLQWTIDQMVRSMTECEKKEDGTMGESEEYLHFVQQIKSGPKGPETYGWSKGIAP